MGRTPRISQVGANKDHGPNNARKILSIFFMFMFLFTIFLFQSQTVQAAGLANSPWPMFHGNARHTGLSPYDTSAANYVLKWSYKTGGSIHSTPAIGPDGTIYVGSLDNKLYAINPDGTLKWLYATRGWMDSSPAIGSDGTIYVGSDDGRLYAINPDGTLKWSYTTGSYVSSSPAIGSDGTIYVGSDDGNLYALEKDSDGDGIGDNSDFLPTFNNNLFYGIIIAIVLFALLSMAVVIGKRMMEKAAVKRLNYSIEIELEKARENTRTLRGYHIDTRPYERELREFEKRLEESK